MLPSAAGAPPASSYPRPALDERRQRQYELNEAYKAAVLLMERLELCVGTPLVELRHGIKDVRQAIALELLALDAEVDW